MMSKKWVFLACLGLFALSLTASAGVTDPNIISAAVAVNGTAPEPLVVVKSGLWQGALVFADRPDADHTTPLYFGDANDLGGLDYVRTTMDDKADADVQFHVTLDKPGTLYLIIDNRVGKGTTNDTTTPPVLGGTIMPWVSAMGFTQTDRAVNISTPATVYALSVTEPNTFVLGAQNDGTSRAMYVVAAAPAGWNLAPTMRVTPASKILEEPVNYFNIDSTLTDDGVPGTPPLSVVWTTTAQPAGSTVTFRPDNTSEDVTVEVTTLGSYTLKATVSDGEKSNTTTVQVTYRLPMFAADAYQQLTACNDSDKGPTSHYTTTVLHVRNYVSGTNTRRRVGFLKYDISDVKREGKVFVNCYLTWNFKAVTSSKHVYVYAINEAQDDFDLSASNAAWVNVPGIKNDWPRGSEITMDTLDLPDISPLLLSYIPAAKETWYSTPTSAALDEIMNSSSDNYITLMFISYDAQSSSFDIEPYSISDSTHIDPDSGLKGIIIKGQVRSPIWASRPAPAINTNAKVSMEQLSWVNPQPSETGATVTSDVYIGTTVPDPLLPNYGLTTLGTGISDAFVAIPAGTLQRNLTYYWVVDSHDSVRPDVTRGFVWSFTTNNNVPTVTMETSNQYLWLGKTGAPDSVIADLNATVEDDGLPQPYTLLWEKVSGPEGAAVVIDPNNVEDINLTLPAVGTYLFRLTADDGDLTASSTVQVVVGETACEAAKLKTDYTALAGDFDDDCDVDMDDLHVMAAHWLDCSSLASCF